MTTNRNYRSSPVTSFNVSHNAADVVSVEFHNCRVMGNLKHRQHDMLQCRATLLIGQSTLGVVIETIRLVQWRLLLVKTQPAMCNEKNEFSHDWKSHRRKTNGHPWLHNQTAKLNKSHTKSNRTNQGAAGMHNYRKLITCWRIVWAHVECSRDRRVGVHDSRCWWQDAAVASSETAPAQPAAAHHHTLTMWWRGIVVLSFGISTKLLYTGPG